MRILLIGEYSNVHWTLAEGLRQRGHQVTVLSNGDFWKNYPRDLSLVRQVGRWGGMKYVAQLLRLLPQLRGYDIVQLINPMFLELKAERLQPIYRYLRRHNRRMVLGAYGMDYYWVSTCNALPPVFKYSDFNIGHELRQNTDAQKERADWLNTPKAMLNQFIAHDCDAIVPGLYEYWRCYEPLFPEKTQFIPYPINTDVPRRQAQLYQKGEPLRIFIGISQSRSEYKGTDLMLKAAQALERAYPERVKLLVAEGIPFNDYCRLMQSGHVILDQLYSYTPAMNALQAMSQRLVCVGGGEPENYELINEHKLRPIVNVEPTQESVYQAVEQLVLHPERIATLQLQSAEYIEKHHQYVKVAERYEHLYQQLLLH